MRKKILLYTLLGILLGKSVLVQGQVNYAPNCSATGTYSSALGAYSNSAGNYSMATGFNLLANAPYSFVFGSGDITQRGLSTGISQRNNPLTNNTVNSFLVGFQNQNVFFAQLYTNEGQISLPGTPIVTEPRVGIGTIAPLASLDVRGISRIENLRIKNNINYLDGSLSFFPLANENLGFEYQSNIPTLTLQGSKVGIGNTNPTATLDVTGRIRAQAIVVDTLISSWQGVENIEYNQAFSFISVSSGVGQGQVGGELEDGPTIPTRTKIMNLTNSSVGIGTETPTGKLEIAGNTLVDKGQLRVSGVLRTEDRRTRSDFQIGDRWLFTRGNSFNMIGLNWNTDHNNPDSKARVYPGSASALFFDESGDIFLRTTSPSSGSGISALTLDNWHSISLKSDGKVGIGTEKPYTSFQIGDTWTFHDGSNDKIIGKNTYYNGRNNIRISQGVASRLYFGNNGDIVLQTASNNSSGSIIDGHWNTISMHNNGNFGIGTGTPKQKLHVEGNSYLNGNVGIGSEQTFGYKLAVNGTIGCKEVIVEVASWYDHVFEPGYHLKNLREVEEFIKENKHLPEIPSAKTVEEEGIGLSEMNGLLLKKVEELTLYVIELQKQIDELKEDKK